MLKIESVSKNYGNLEAVKNLSLELKPGQVLGLLGANGAGKTTTFRMILNSVSKTSGTITLNGEKIDFHNSKKIGYLCEERALYNKYTIERQLKLFAELKGMHAKDIEEKIDYWLDYFNLSDKKTVMLKELSKGNQQKVQFISAIIHEPELIILDEPFSGLDPFNVGLFKKVILEHQEKGHLIIFSSHRLDQVEFFCNDIIVLVEGKAILEGQISELKRSSNIHYINIKSDIPNDKLLESEIVKNVEKNGEYTKVFLKNIGDVEKLFELLKGYKCTHFSQELPSLEEVFIEKVGIKYES